jgi:hypothetical protein
MITVFEIVIYVAVTLVALAVAIDKKSGRIAVLATMIPMWEESQVILNSPTSVILSVTYDHTSASWVTYTVSAFPFMFALALVAVLCALELISFSAPEGT